MFKELDDLVEIIHAPAYFFDMETLLILAANVQFARLMGYEQRELTEMSIEALRPAEELPKLRRALRSAPPEGSVEWRYLHRSGSLVYVQITYRNSVFVDRRTEAPRDVRMVVVSKWGDAAVRSSDELFG